MARKGNSGSFGQHGRKGGRPPDTPNKATTNAREAIAAFVEANTPRLQGWLDQIAAEQGAAAAFKCVMDLLEYHVPKLARTELTGKDGGALQIARVVDELHPESTR